MSAAVATLAKKYYPRMWDQQRLIDLVKAGKLTAKEYKQITGEAYTADEQA